MRTEQWAIDRVKPYENNPRDNAGAVDAVAASIREFGFRQPIVVDADGVIIAGHTRLLAAQKLGMTRVPVHVAKDLEPAKARAYRLADNKSGELATWDANLLPMELAALEPTGLDFAEFGFDLDAIAALAKGGSGGLTDPNDVPPAPEEKDAITQPGDLWLLGEHRLVCGDCTDAATVALAMGDSKPGLMVTDPPYGVEYDPSWRAEAGVNKNAKKMGVVANDDRADWGGAWGLFPGDACYVYHAALFASVVQASLEASDFAIRAQIVWAKDRMALGRGDYHWQHEPCWYAVRDGKPGGRNDDRSQTTLWTIPARDDAGHGHGTQKPVECMERPIRNHEPTAVYDPFCGSGTTIIACERTGRACVAIEIMPNYCDVIVARWEAYTGLKAERVPAGGEAKTAKPRRKKNVAKKPAPKPGKKAQP